MEQAPVPVQSLDYATKPEGPLKWVIRVIAVSAIALAVTRGAVDVLYAMQGWNALVSIASAVETLAVIAIGLEILASASIVAAGLFCFAGCGRSWLVISISMFLLGNMLLGGVQIYSIIESIPSTMVQHWFLQAILTMLGSLILPVMLIWLLSLRPIKEGFR